MTWISESRLTRLYHIPHLPLPFASESLWDEDEFLGFGHLWSRSSVWCGTASGLRRGLGVTSFPFPYKDFDRDKPTSYRCPKVYHLLPRRSPFTRDKVSVWTQDQGREVTPFTVLKRLDERGRPPTFREGTEEECQQKPFGISWSSYSPSMTLLVYVYLLLFVIVVTGFIQIQIIF